MMYCEAETLLRAYEGDAEAAYALYEASRIFSPRRRSTFRSWKLRAAGFLWRRMHLAKQSGNRLALRRKNTFWFREVTCKAC